MNRIAEVFMESRVTSFVELADKLSKKTPRSVVLVQALTSNIVRPVAEAARGGFVRATLVGPEEKVRAAIPDIDPDTEPAIQIIDAATEAESVQTATRLVREGEANVLIQGRIRFRNLRAAIEAEGSGLDLGRRLSGLFLFENPRPAPRKLLAVTDHIVHPEPGEIELRQSIENAVFALQKLGVMSPNVALISGANRVTEELGSTQKAEIIAQSFHRGVLDGCLVDGPFTLDVALDRGCAESRKIVAPVAGNADLLVAPRLETARVLVDALHWIAEVDCAQILLGASIPIVLTSRTDKPGDRLRSLQLACMLV